LNGAFGGVGGGVTIFVITIWLLDYSGKVRL
jgi:hypothetical protein